MNYLNTMSETKINKVNNGEKSGKVFWLFEKVDILNEITFVDLD